MATSTTEAIRKAFTRSSDQPNPAQIITTAGSLPAPVNTGYTVAEAHVLDQMPELQSLIGGMNTVTKAVGGFGKEYFGAQKEGVIEAIENASYVIPGPDGKPVNVFEIPPPPIDESLLSDDPAKRAEQINKYNSAWEESRGYPEFRAAANKYYTTPVEEGGLGIPEGWEHIPSIRRSMEQSEANAFAVLVNKKLQEDRDRLISDPELSVESIAQDVVGQNNPNGYLRQALAPVLANHRGAIGAARSRLKRERFSQNQVTAYKFLSDQIVNAGDNEDAYKQLPTLITDWQKIKANMTKAGFPEEAALIEDTMVQELKGSIASAWKNGKIEGATIEDKRRRVEDMTSFLVLDQDALKSISYYEEHGRFHPRSAAAHETWMQTLGEVDLTKTSVLGEITSNVIEGYVTTYEFETLDNKTISGYVDSQGVDADITADSYKAMADKIAPSVVADMNKDREAEGLDPIDTANVSHMRQIKGRIIRTLEGRFDKVKRTQQGSVQAIDLINDNSKQNAVLEVEAGIQNLYRKWQELKADATPEEKAQLNSDFESLIKTKYTQRSLIEGQPSVEIYALNNTERDGRLADWKQIPLYLSDVLSYRDTFTDEIASSLKDLVGLVPHPDQAKNKEAAVGEYQALMLDSSRRLADKKHRKAMERLTTPEEKKLYMQNQYTIERDKLQKAWDRIRERLSGAAADYKERVQEPPGWADVVKETKSSQDVMVTQILSESGLSDTNDNRRRIIELVVALQTKSGKHQGAGKVGRDITEVDWGAARKGAIAVLNGQTNKGWAADGVWFVQNPDNPSLLQNTKPRLWGMIPHEGAARGEWLWHLLQNERATPSFKPEATVSPTLLRVVSRNVLRLVGLDMETVMDRGAKGDAFTLNSGLITILQGGGRDLYLSDLSIGIQAQRAKMTEVDWRRLWEVSQKPRNEGGLGRAEKEEFRYDPLDAPRNNQRYKAWRTKLEENDLRQAPNLAETAYNRAQENRQEVQGGWPDAGWSWLSWEDNLRVRSLVINKFYPQAEE